MKWLKNWRWCEWDAWEMSKEIELNSCQEFRLNHVTFSPNEALTTIIVAKKGAVAAFNHTYFTLVTKAKFSNNTYWVCLSLSLSHSAPLAAALGECCAVWTCVWCVCPINSECGPFLINAPRVDRWMLLHFYFNCSALEFYVKRTFNNIKRSLPRVCMLVWATHIARIKDILWLCGSAYYDTKWSNIVCQFSRSLTLLFIYYNLFASQFSTHNNLFSHILGLLLCLTHSLTRPVAYRILLYTCNIFMMPKHDKTLDWHVLFHE